jgi:hypothetical protein
MIGTIEERNCGRHRANVEIGQTQHLILIATPRNNDTIPLLTSSSVAGPSSLDRLALPPCRPLTSALALALALALLYAPRLG